MTETGYMLEQEHPTVAFPAGILDDESYRTRLIELVKHGASENVLDAIEVFESWLAKDRKAAFTARINSIFDGEESPLRLADGKCLKLDTEFVGVGSTAAALERLGLGPFSGAAAEFAEALREQASGDTKHAISEAHKSYESTLKVLTDLNGATADKLTKELIRQGYLDDLSAEFREGFRQSVLMALPFLRNRLAGHGQGADVIEMPKSYGTLALQIAAALQNFLIEKYLERHPAKENPSELWDTDFI